MRVCPTGLRAEPLLLGVILPASGNYWITSPTTSANTDLLDCNSWTSSSAAPNQGSTISIGSPSQLFIAYCNTSHQIACWTIECGVRSKVN